MPSAEAVLAHLERAANGAAALAVVWHVAAAVALAALVLGWKPSNRQAGLLSIAPIASAAAVAFAFGNPFNGGVLASLASVLLVLTRRLDSRPVVTSRGVATVAGALAIAFGAFYPHFLEGPSVLAYLYAAPAGVLPCPTVAIGIGIALMTRGLGSRTWSVVLAAAGLFYGAFGVLRLGVYLDLALAGGALALLAGTRTTTFVPDSPGATR